MKKYTSKGAVPYTAKFKPATFNGYRRNRVNAKSLVEHSRPLFLNQLDELDALVEEFPGLYIPQHTLYKASISELRKPDSDILFERFSSIGWKDATRRSAQYAKHSPSRVPRRKRKGIRRGPKLHAEKDGIYFNNSAQIQFYTPPVIKDITPELITEVNNRKEAV